MARAGRFGAGPAAASATPPRAAARALLPPQGVSPDSPQTLLLPHDAAPMSRGDLARLLQTGSAAEAPEPGEPETGAVSAWDLQAEGESRALETELAYIVGGGEQAAAGGDQRPRALRLLEMAATRDARRVLRSSGLASRVYGLLGKQSELIEGDELLGRAMAGLCALLAKDCCPAEGVDAAALEVLLRMACATPTAPAAATEVEGGAEKRARRRRGFAAQLAAALPTPLEPTADLALAALVRLVEAEADGGEASVRGAGDYSGSRAVRRRLARCGAVGALTRALDAAEGPRSLLLLRALQAVSAPQPTTAGPPVPTPPLLVPAFARTLTVGLEALPRIAAGEDDAALRATAAASRASLQVLVNLTHSSPLSAAAVCGSPLWGLLLRWTVALMRAREQYTASPASAVSEADADSGRLSPREFSFDCLHLVLYVLINMAEVSSDCRERMRDYEVVCVAADMSCGRVAAAPGRSFPDGEAFSPPPADEEVVGASAVGAVRYLCGKALQLTQFEEDGGEGEDTDVKDVIVAAEVAVLLGLASKAHTANSRDLLAALPQRAVTPLVRMVRLYLSLLRESGAGEEVVEALEDVVALLQHLGKHGKPRDLPRPSASPAASPAASSASSAPVLQTPSPTGAASASPAEVLAAGSMVCKLGDSDDDFVAAPRRSRQRPAGPATGLAEGAAEASATGKASAKASAKATGKSLAKAKASAKGKAKAPRSFDFSSEPPAPAPPRVEAPAPPRVEAPAPPPRRAGSSKRRPIAAAAAGKGKGKGKAKSVRPPASSPPSFDFS